MKCPRVYLRHQQFPLFCSRIHVFFQGYRLCALVLIVTPSSGELQPARLTTALMARVKVSARRKNALQAAIMEKKLQVTKCRIMYAREMC